MAIPFTVMTWNVENLFPVGHTSGPNSRDIYERKMRNIAQTVLAIAPDVLGVQEIGDPATFADLQRRLNDRYPYTFLSQKPDPRGIRVGFLSRMPMVQAREFDKFPPTSILTFANNNGKPMNNMGRGVLKVTVVVAPGLLINIVNIHLKSKLVTYEGGRRYPLDEDERARETGFATAKRTAEAVAVRVYINSLITGNSDPLILLGDFNDGSGSMTSQILAGPADRSLSTRDKFDDIRLYDLSTYIAADRRYSRMYLKEREMIDHILCSSELIFHRKQVDSFVEPIENIDSNVEVRKESPYPDHAPVFARFDVPTKAERDARDPRLDLGSDKAGGST